ncbi:beta-lactamase family protein [Chloroflexi bacterium TSY]|nr:beta-lactamase family protein [Chloroflexi bacterium TSY]
MAELEKTIDAVEQGLRASPVFLDNASIAPTNLSERMVHHNVPGVSVAVIDNGAIAWAKGYGVLNAESRSPVTTNTPFAAASVTKPVAALAALRLVQQGRLDLDRDVNQTLQQWRVPESELTRSAKVTLRHLLSHTSGLDAGNYCGYTPDEPMPTLLQLLNGEPPSNSKPVRVLTVPGTRYSYSGAGYWVVQQLIEETMDESFASVMQKLVFDPLSMNHSTIGKPDGAASGHADDGSVTSDNRTRYPGAADGGMWSTPTDIARFALAVMNAYNGTGQQILEQPLAQAVLTPQIGLHGLGPFLIGDGDTLRFMHGGEGPGFLCQMDAFPLRGQGAVILTNGDNGWWLIQEVLRSLATVYQWPHHQPIGKTRVKIDTARLTACAGTYQVNVDPLTLDRFAEYTGQWQIRDGRPIDYTIQARGDHLVVRYPNDEALTFYPESDETFFALEDATELIFQPTKGGTVNALEAVTNNGLRLCGNRLRQSK